MAFEGFKGRLVCWQMSIEQRHSTGSQVTGLPVGHGLIGEAAVCHDTRRIGFERSSSPIWPTHFLESGFFWNWEHGQ